MSRKALAGLVIVFLALLACGKADPASTAKCAASPSGDACEECCSQQGRNGHRYVSGKGCECL